jgi:tripartite-type tricarboxylate transporter receptor subunit TctC
MGTALGQTVVVENKGGGGGAIGAGEVARATPDGYTLLMSSVSTMATNPAINPKTPYDPNTDFVHIVNVAATPNVFAVGASFAAKDYASFAALLRKEPGRHSYASAGVGSVGHPLAEVYKSTTGLFMTHIPYRGSGPALTDVVAGQLGVVVDNLPTALPFILDKRLTAIAVAAPARLAQLPNVPTFAELGLPAVNRMSFLGVSAPKGTPKDVVEKLNAAVRTALSDAVVKQRIESTGAIVVGNTAAAFQQQIKDEFEVYRTAVKAQGLKPD